MDKFLSTLIASHWFAPMLMSTALVLSSAAPPAQVIAEEHETQHSGEGARENLLRQRSCTRPDQRNGQGSVCPALSRNLVGALGVVRFDLDADASEASFRNGHGGPLLL